MRPGTLWLAFTVFASGVGVSGCALSGKQEAVRWLVVDGCMTEVSGMTALQVREFAESIEIGDDCSVKTDTTAQDDSDDPGEK
jgi:hypothetical protein